MFRTAERTFITAERTFPTAECTYRSGEHNSNIGFTYIYCSLTIYVDYLSSYL